MEQTGAQGKSERPTEGKNCNGNRVVRAHLTAEAMFEQRDEGEGLSYTYTWGVKHNGAHI